MKYLLFDQKAISAYVSNFTLQSIEFSQGKRLVDHVCGKLSSEIFENTVVEYTKSGILFVGQRNIETPGSSLEHRLFCIDLTACNLLIEESNPSDLLAIIQKSFRLTLKIWNRQPFSLSERYHETKSILFPFSFPDRRRLVIERSNNISRFDRRGIKHALLAYKYNSDDPYQIDEVADTSVLKKACDDYFSQYIPLQKKIKDSQDTINSEKEGPILQIFAQERTQRDDFIFWTYDRQYESLTDSQKSVVDYSCIDAPLRIEGPAGTGKTISMIMRAYHLLCTKQEQGKPFHIIFFAHSESTSHRNEELFSLYDTRAQFLNPASEQNILFTTLLEFNRKFSKISETNLLEHDAIEAKNYQLYLISSIVERAFSSNLIKTYRPLLSEAVRDLFDCNKTSPNALYMMLQHEFSIQIKGRTNCTISDYYDLSPIPNGIQYENKHDRELIFSLFSSYQDELQSIGAFDIDDVTMETIAHLDAPIWRRRRSTEGYDYIFVDEMHLFNLNEQSIFHFLTKSLTQKNIPICFALDYSQAIGDRGDTHQDYIETAFGTAVEGKKLKTIFRNSPYVANFCSSIAAAGTLMFGSNFNNPYIQSQSAFTDQEENKSFKPQLHLYHNDHQMVDSLDTHIKDLIKNLQCKPCEIAVVSFENNLLTSEGVTTLEQAGSHKFNLLDINREIVKNKICLSSPYAINGLEFQAVILLGADEGRVPQTSGTNDISQHFIRYSAYNLLYLSASRAKYSVQILGSKLNGTSSCLEHSLQNDYLQLIDHTEA